MKRKKELKLAEQARKKPRFLLGLTAGIAGGLAGAAAKAVVEEIYAARESERPPATELLAPEVRGRAAVRHEMHWTFGAAAGGVYGMLAEVWPEITESRGAAFGALIDFALQDSTLPATGVGLRPAERGRGTASNVTTHAVYGLTTEFVRKHMRSWLERNEAERGIKRKVDLKQSA
ncbi:MAG TPA: DUF1440 domain-containing protein [Acidobacteriaceae bacterium]|nr:DUF1440 domain-containing protein [Acidobacteriaceae bacterium]